MCQSTTTTTMENTPTARGRSGRTERTVSPKASNNRDIAKMRAHVSHPPMKSTSTRNLTKKKSSSTSSTTATTTNSSSKNRKSRSLSPTPKKIRALRRTWTMQNDADLSSCSATSASSCSSSCSFHTKIDIPAAPPGPPILKNAINANDSVVVTRQRRRPRRVEFDITEIREHAMILDEGNEDGPAMLTIDWECQNTTVTTVQEYYLERSMDRGPVRAMEPTERAAILIRAGGCMDVAYLTQNLALTESQHLCLTGTTTTTTTTKHAKTLHPSCSGGGEKKKKGYFSKMKKAAKVAVYGKTPKEVNSTASQ